MKSILTAVLAYMIIFAPAALCDDLQFDVSTAGVVEEFGAGHVRADVHIGTLPLASRGRVEIRIVNNTPRDIHFDGAFSNCSCAKATISDTALLAGETITVEAILDTPKVARAIQQDVLLKLDNKEDPKNGMQIIMRYSLTKVAAFKDKLIMVEAPSGKTEFEFSIPLLVSEDIDVKDLKLEFSGSLIAAKANVVNSNGSFSANCAIPRKDLISSETVGEMQIRNTKTGSIDFATCLIKTKNPIDVKPDLIRFVPVDDNTFRATCIVKLESSAYPKYGDKIQASSIGCKSDFGDIKMECRQIAPFLYRAVLNYKRPTSGEGPTELYWSVSAGEETANAKNRVFISSLGSLSNLKEGTSK